MTNRALIATVLFFLACTCTACHRAPRSNASIKPAPISTDASAPVIAAKPEPSATPTNSPTPADATPEPPAPLSPPDGVSGAAHELIWAWERPLADDEWFELQIWSDLEGATPQPYGWSREQQYTVTASRLLPGEYRWRVVVVRGREPDERVELSPPGEEWTFRLVRPSTVAKIGPAQPTHTEPPASIPTPEASVETTPTPTNAAPATEIPARPDPTATVPAGLPPNH